MRATKASLQAGLDEKVESLKRRAQAALESGPGRLVDESGSLGIGFIGFRV